MHKKKARRDIPLEKVDKNLTTIDDINLFKESSK
jgi:hypothetical protein